MRIHHLETLADHDGDQSGSLMLKQQFSHGHRQLRAVALAIAGSLLLLPFATILFEPAARERLLALTGYEPLAALQLGIVAMVGFIALCLGCSELLRSIVRERIVKIDRCHAVVEDVVGGRRRQWQEPIRSYEGVRHLVQTRSSGPVHMLMLEHRHRSRSLCIAYGTHVANQALVEAARSYDLPVLSGRRRGIVDRLTAVLPTFLERSARTTTSATQVAGT